MRKTRKQRKQKGGGQIFLQFQPGGSSSLLVPITNTTTPKDLLEHYLQSDKVPPGLLQHSFLTNLSEPSYILSKKPQGLPLFPKKNWNKPFPFEQNATYYLRANLKKKERRAQNIEESIPILQQVFDYYAKKTAFAKVILASSAATDAIPKNVRQQFKFHRDPPIPILLIDPAFFTEGRYEFYKYLDFEEKELIPGRVKIYTKPAGTPLQITNTNSSDVILTKQQKKEYLQEVEKQAHLLYDLEKEIEICCIQAYIDLTKDFKNRIPPGFKVYGFDD